MIPSLCTSSHFTYDELIKEMQQTHPLPCHNAGLLIASVPSPVYIRTRFLLILRHTGFMHIRCVDSPKVESP